MFNVWAEWLLGTFTGADDAHRTLVLYMGGLVVLAVAALFVALRHFIGGHSQAGERLETIAVLAKADEEERRAKARRPSVFSRLVMRLSLADSVARDLDRANVSLSVPEFLLISLAVAAAAFGIGVLRGSAVLGLLLALIGFEGMRIWLRRRARQYRQAFGGQLVDFINLTVGALRAGYGVVQAMNMVVREMPPPASQEMNRIVRQIQLGLSLSAALDNSVQRLQNDDWAMIVNAIKIQTEVGGNLAEILSTVAQTIRERVRILGEVRVITTQQRLTGWLLSIMPVVLAVILYIANPGYMSGLFSPGLPFLLAIVGAVGIILGAIVIRRIVAIEV
ncbi:MAG: type II secretion system F family protein [Anaerolineae bacterium]